MRNVGLIDSVIVKELHQYVLWRVFSVVFEDGDQDILIIYRFTAIDYSFNF